MMILLAAGTFAASIASADPTTQPAAASSPDLLILPFTALGKDNSLDWAGRGVQQNLLTDLARGKLRVMAADKSYPGTTEAQAAARAVGARLLLTGTYQVNDTLVRFNGQIIDVASGNVLGGISATGAIRDLFSMEDALSTQAVQQLSQLPGANAVAIAKAPGNVLAPNAPAAPQVVVQVIQPPAAAPMNQPMNQPGYQGSALQQYVDSDRTPSTDYAQQNPVPDNQPPYDYGYSPLYGTYYAGGYDYGLIYSTTSSGTSSGGNRNSNPPPVERHHHAGEQSNGVTNK